MRNGEAKKINSSECLRALAFAKEVQNGRHRGGEKDYKKKKEKRKKKHNSAEESNAGGVYREPQQKR